MKFVLGVDPGKAGAFVLVSESGEIVKVWDMPYNGSTLSAPATAEIYRDVLTITGSRELHVFIEKAFTKPTDALSVQQWDTVKALREAAKSVLSGYLRHKSGVEVPKERFEALFDDLRREVEYTDWLDAAGFRPDGRLGNFNYAKAAGVLEICAAFGIAYTLVSPVTWCSVIHQGADGNLRAKDKSKQILERRWPEAARKGSLLWRDRGRKIDDGRLDAYLVAIYGLSLRK